jgi:hypothetical protein
MSQELGFGCPDEQDIVFDHEDLLLERGRYSSPLLSSLLHSSSLSLSLSLSLTGIQYPLQSYIIMGPCDDCPCRGLQKESLGCRAGQEGVCIEGVGWIWKCSRSR